MTGVRQARGSPAAQVVTPESFSYTLTLGGRFAGTQDWVVRPDVTQSGRGTVVARVQTDFSGALPAGRRVQESRVDPATGFSLAYAEAEGSNRRPSFETIFDERSGLVTLRQGKDEASQPLLESHHDPLSLLLWLRGQHGSQDDQETVAEPEQAEHPEPDMVTVRMVGGRVHLQPLPGGVVSGQAAWVYFLRPGGAYVYVEQAAPHRLLRLIQPSDFGPVEALLSPAQAAQGQSTQGQGHLRPVNRQEHPRAARGQVGKPRRRK